MQSAFFRVNLDDDLAEWVRSEAERKRCSFSRVLKELVIEAVMKSESVKKGK